MSKKSRALPLKRTTRGFISVDPHAIPAKITFKFGWMTSSPWSLLKNAFKRFLRSTQTHLGLQLSSFQPKVVAVSYFELQRGRLDWQCQAHLFMGFHNITRKTSSFLLADFKIEICEWWIKNFTSIFRSLTEIDAPNDSVNFCDIQRWLST